jgi:hypothetical protein
MLSHAVDGATESCYRQCYRVMLATELPEQIACGVILMSSHAGDGAAKSC